MPLSATVPKDVSVNWTARDLRPYLEGEEEKELVEGELLPHQKYDLGVIPRHGRRALQAGTIAGSIGGGIGLVSSITDGASAAESLRQAAQAAGSAAQSAGTTALFPVKDIQEGIERYQDTNRKEAIEPALAGRQTSKGILGILAPIRNALDRYRRPGKETAETAARRLAKAQRKRDRRENDVSFIEGYLKRPLLDRARAKRSVKDQGDAYRVELGASPRS
jgi:hypothetical protein